MSLLLSVVSLATGAGGVVIGVMCARIFVRHYRESIIPVDSSQQILRGAGLKREAALKAGLGATREHLEREAQREDEERDVVRQMQENFDADLSKRQSDLDKKAHEQSLVEAELEKRIAAVRDVEAKIAETEHRQREVRGEYLSLLEAKAATDRGDLQQKVQAEIVDAEGLIVQKWVLDEVEEIRDQSAKTAQAVLNVVSGRYSSRFVWPKTTFSIEVTNKELAAEHFSKGKPLMTDLTRDSQVQIDLLQDEGENPVLKFSGGAGTEKEALRLTFEELINRKQFGVEKAQETLERFRRQVEKLNLKSAEDAARKLGLRDIHPEILKLLGALSYRTSHRQNQFYHSLEVAILSGMLATELGLDPLPAKRAGLLHDVGKALDYKIEGSHAVISAEFIAKYGENPDIVDVVWSHHDDKIVQTPFAFVLKAADAMSGARPGARVEMEEGYQKRIDSIADVIRSFERSGVVNSAIMHAGREIHVFVDNRRVKEKDVESLAGEIVKKLESDVEFPGQIRVTVVRRLEVTEVA